MVGCFVVKMMMVDVVGSVQNGICGVIIGVMVVVGFGCVSIFNVVWNCWYIIIICGHLCLCRTDR